MHSSENSGSSSEQMSTKEEAPRCLIESNFVNITVVGNHRTAGIKQGWQEKDQYQSVLHLLIVIPDEQWGNSPIAQEHKIKQKFDKFQDM